MICGVIWELTGLLLFRCNHIRSDDVTKDHFEWGPETNNREGDGRRTQFLADSEISNSEETVFFKVFSHKNATSTKNAASLSKSRETTGRLFILRFPVVSRDF
jgi:hypothetical protein